MKISRKQIEIPGSCPKDCPEKGGPFYQGSFCTHCPVFNCVEESEVRLI
jgi:hypothetical protein